MRPPRPPRPSGHGSRPQGRPDRPHLAKGEIRYHGRNACKALFRNRPKDIIRIYVKRELSAEFSEILEFCAKNRKSYHLVNDGDLEKLTDTKHHDGVCLVATEKPYLREQDFLRELGSGRNLILYLDGVGNPHNLGAILRTAAHFGVKYVSGEAADLPRISPAANRTSEGGAEHISLVRVEDPEDFIDRLKSRGFQVFALDMSERAIPLFGAPLGDKCVFVLGSEVNGVSGMMRSSADGLLRVPGTGLIESINVSVAAALGMAEFHRQGSDRGPVRIVKKNPVV